MKWGKRIFQFIGVVAAAVFTLLVAGIVLIKLSPATSAYGADALRNIIGDQPVAIMEMTLFQIQDAMQSVEYRLGLAKAGNPFGQVTPLTPEALPQNKGLSTTASATPAPGQAKIHSPNHGVSSIQKNAAHSLASSKAEKMVPVTGSSSQIWTPPIIIGQSGPYGNGQWLPYLKDSSGQVIAYRTFVQPDPGRPYTFAAIVAFDLHHSNLHYVIGSQEPYAPGVPKTSTGTIPEADRQPGLLLAAFNGGFKYEHGHSGSMSNGLVSVPPRDSWGTVAIYQNGDVKIGSWGQDIQPGPDMLAFRQNGPLVIQNGAINPMVNNSILWGLTLAGKTVTYRSGMAISADGGTLYYFAGPYLTAPTLAAAMEMVHPLAGIQLDINDYWVYFSGISDKNGQLDPEPLLPKGMLGNNDRFLRPYTRDFFYLTAKP